MATQFDPIAEFRNDHRKVRDLLLSLAEAIEKGQLETARTTLGKIDALVGPHFRYEEEALYPTLKQFLGEYVESLVEEHDGTIGTARTAASLLAKPSISPEEAKAAAKAAWRIWPRGMKRPDGPVFHFSSGRIPFVPEEQPEPLASETVS